ncbi:MAG: tetratricopeptide repeat protein [Gemmatimonadaceae bacterium]|nr:tetratricopeptide repeat protein [Gemmatimonadaceae bacterium]
MPTPRSGSTFGELGLTDSTRRAAERALGLWREQGNALRTGVSLNNIGNVLLDRRQLDSARVIFGLALERRRTSGDRRGEGITLLNLGRTELLSAHHDSAVTVLRAAMAQIRATSNGGSEGIALSALGSAFAAARARPDSAAALLSRLA